MLSDLQANLKGTGGDTPVFELAGAAPGGTMIVIGGTHPPEIAGMMAAVLLIENARVTRGRLIVVPQANRSGFTYTEPMQAYFHSFEIARPDGSRRWFRVGMRLSNPAEQWPDPDVYVHMPSGEQMIGHESRNLNRNHPGLPRGTLTAEVSNALTTLARQADVIFDLHETRPENTLNNTIVAHERAFETAAYAVEFLKASGLSTKYERSPVNLHGLSHREFGDFTKAQAVLAETTNPAMGRFRGRLSGDLLLKGKDGNYVEAAKLGRLFVAFDDSGAPLEKRVGRHLAAVKEIVNAYNELNPRTPIVIEGIPPYDELVGKGLGAFLQPPPRP
jgi:predicted deacylase